MNLIYLYIKKHKVLEQEEITLTSQYTVAYDNNKFEIKDSQLESDFFTENLDIVALFGKNGAGKSTAIDVVTSVLGKKELPDAQFVSVYEIEGVFFYDFKGDYRQSDVNVLYKSKRVKHLSENNSFDKGQNVIFFSHHVEPLAKKTIYRTKGLFNYLDCSNQKYVSKLNNKKFQNEEIRKTFNLLKSYSDFSVHEEYEFDKVPMSGEFRVEKELSKKLKCIFSSLIKSYDTLGVEPSGLLPKDIVHSLFDLALHFDVNMYENEPRTIVYDDDQINNQNEPSVTFVNFLNTELITKIIGSLFENRKKRLLDIIIEFEYLVIEVENLNSRIQSGNIDKTQEEFEKFLGVFLEYLKGRYNSDSAQFTIDQFSSYTHDFEFDIKDHRPDYADNYEISQISDYVEKSMYKQNKPLKKVRFAVETYDEFVGLNEVFNRYKELFSEYEFKWNGISSGQNSILTLFARIFDIYKKFNEVTIFIDEGEIHLHPEWQRNYINELVRFFSSTNTEQCKIKLVITSHSPFVLCDLPNESINFIGEKDRLNTPMFASNIYDLYNKGFGLKRTIGEFSHTKLKETIQSIKKGELSYKEILKRSNSIGDLFVSKMIKDLGEECND